MISFTPRFIQGRWRVGYALDLHTLKSVYLGDDEYGNAQFDTTRSEIGELLYQLKYRRDQSGVAAIVEAATSYVQQVDIVPEVVVPIPPSKSRTVQPVYLLAEQLAAALGCTYAQEAVTRSGKVPEMKEVYDYDERTRLLDNAHKAQASAVTGKRVLLFDDLYRSGATMNAVASMLYDTAGAADVVALTVTRTRSNR